MMLSDQRKQDTSVCKPIIHVCSQPQQALFGKRTHPKGPIIFRFQLTLITCKVTRHDVQSLLNSQA